MVIDAGTGDGHRILRLARQNPQTLYVGVDSDTAAMAEAARRASAKPSRGGCSNALFVASGVDAWPVEAFGVAALVTVEFPWGSLLRGVLGEESPILDGLAGMLGDDGRLEVTLSVVERDRVAMPGETELVRAYRASGLDVVESRPATAEEVGVLGSTWARRLAAGRQRPVWRVSAIRTPAVAESLRC